MEEFSQPNSTAWQHRQAFLPMYLASIGIEFPMIGFPSIDTSPKAPPKSMMLMTAALMTGTALSEVRGEMSLKTFALPGSVPVPTFCAG